MSQMTWDQGDLPANIFTSWFNLSNTNSVLFFPPLRLSAHWLIYICCCPCLCNWSKAALVMFAWSNHNSLLFPTNLSCLDSASWPSLTSSHGFWPLLPPHSTGWHLQCCAPSGSASQFTLVGVGVCLYCLLSTIGEGYRIVKQPAPSTQHWTKDFSGIFIAWGWGLRIR